MLTQHELAVAVNHSVSLVAQRTGELATDKTSMSGLICKTCTALQAYFHNEVFHGLWGFDPMGCGWGLANVNPGGSTKANHPWSFIEIVGTDSGCALEWPG